MLANIKRAFYQHYVIAKHHKNCYKPLVEYLKTIRNHVIKDGVFLISDTIERAKDSNRILHLI